MFHNNVFQKNKIPETDQECKWGRSPLILTRSLRKETEFLFRGFLKKKIWRLPHLTSDLSPSPPMESVAAAAIATTSRSLPLPFSTTLHRRRRSVFLPVAASKRKRSPLPIPSPLHARLISISPVSSGVILIHAPFTGQNDDGKEVAKGPGSEPTSLAPYGGLSLSPLSKVRTLRGGCRLAPKPPVLGAIR